MVFLLVCVGLSGCLDNEDGCQIQSSEEKRFVGTWATDNITMAQLLVGTSITFFSDTTTSFPNSYYEVKDGKLVITTPESKWVLDYSFSNNDNVLTLSSVSHPEWIADYTKQ